MKDFVKMSLGKTYYVQGVGILFDHGTTVPADGTADYAPGAIFQHTDGTTSTVLYVNEGTLASCDFNALAAPIDILMSAAILSEAALLVLTESDLLVEKSTVNAVSESLVATRSDLLVEKSTVNAVSESLVATRSDLLLTESDLLVEKSTVNAVSESLVATLSEVKVLDSEMSAAQAAILDRDGLKISTVTSTVALATTSYLRISTAATVYNVAKVTVA